MTEQTLGGSATSSAASADAPAVSPVTAPATDNGDDPDSASSASSASSADSAAQDSSIEEPADALSVESITPMAVAEDATLTVSGTVTNTEDAPLDSVTVRLRYSSQPLTTRTSLAHHADGEAPQPQRFGTDESLDEALEPGDSVDYTLRIDMEDIDVQDFGVYPLTVDAVDSTGSTLGALDSFLPYTGSPDEEIEPTEIAWVWPLADRPQRADDDTYLGNELAEQLAPGGRLDRLLTLGLRADSQGADDDAEDEETESTDASEPDEDEPSGSEGSEDEDNGVGGAPPATRTDGIPLTWAVDPALVDDVSRMTSSYQVLQNPTAVPAQGEPRLEPHEPDPNAGAWLDRAQEGLAETSVVPSAYASPSIGSLVEADLEQDAIAAHRLATETLDERLDLDVGAERLWLPRKTADAASLELLAEEGATTFVFDDSALPAQDWAGHTPDAATVLTVGDDTEVTALATDRRLSEILGTPVATPGETTLAQQRYIAETALISAERPDTGQTVIAAPPATWNPTADLLSALVTATESLPWLEPVALEDLAEDAQPLDERQDLRAAEDSPARLSSAYLDQISDIRAEADLFSSILTEDDDPYRPAILRLESAAWAEEGAPAASARQQVATALEESMGSVRIMPGEPVTMASKSGEAPILVANDLPDHSVTVHLSVFSQNSERLAVGDYADTMEIAPGGKTTVYVPLSASVNGRTELEIGLHNADGEPISEDETTLPVNVTGLGTSALVISGFAALLLVALLMLRTIRRWRRKHTPASSADTSVQNSPEMRHNGDGPDDDSHSEDVNVAGDARINDASSSDSTTPGVDETP
ncbi:DUF6049 family protein [Lipingzhangella rawalii]